MLSLGSSFILTGMYRRLTLILLTAPSFDRSISSVGVYYQLLAKFTVMGILLRLTKHRCNVGRVSPVSFAIVCSSFSSLWSIFSTSRSVILETSSSRTKASPTKRELACFLLSSTDNHMPSPKVTVFERTLADVYDGNIWSSMSTSSRTSVCESWPSISLNTISPDSVHR